LNQQHNKIFVLGYNKTGTKSLSKALTILGFKVMDTNGGGQLLLDVFDNLKNNKPILNQYQEYDAFIDYPIFEPTIFSHIVDEYPNANYISLTRNLDDYVESVLKDKVKRLQQGIIDSWNWLGVGKQEVFENYPEYQKNWIKNRTEFKHQSNLNWLKKKDINWLDLDICSGDEWNKLCNYLGTEVPNVKFPNINKSRI